MNKVRLETLRIGSYVNFKNRTDIDYCEVTHLGFPGYVHILRNFKDGENNDDQPENIKDITGIPMSKEWALRFGATQLFNGGSPYYVFHWGRNGIETVVESARYPDCWEMPFSAGYTKVFQFVHELQNLVAAHTNEFLKFKP